LDLITFYFWFWGGEVVGDIKAHTYRNGIVQTGVPYPNCYNATSEGYVDLGYDRSSVCQMASYRFCAKVLQWSRLTLKQ